MDKAQGVVALGALAQATRLDIFRYLVQIGAEGAAAGQIGERFQLPLPTLSFHLKTLQQAGLIQRVRQSRSLIYSADMMAIKTLVGYLTENCCEGRPEVCGWPPAREASQL